MTAEREKEIRELVAKALDRTGYPVPSSRVRSGVQYPFYPETLVLDALLPLLDAAEAEAARGREAIEALRCLYDDTAPFFDFRFGKGGWSIGTPRSISVHLPGASFVRAQEFLSAEMARREAEKPKHRFYAEAGCVFDWHDDGRAVATFSGIHAERYAREHAERLNAEVKP